MRLAAYSLAQVNGMLVPNRTTGYFIILEGQMAKKEDGKVWSVKKTDHMANSILNVENFYK